MTEKFFNIKNPTTSVVSLGSGKSVIVLNPKANTMVSETVLNSFGNKLELFNLEVTEIVRKAEAKKVVKETKVETPPKVEEIPVETQEESVPVEEVIEPETKSKKKK